MHAQRTTLWLAIILLSLPAALSAQKAKKRPASKPDPYTQGDAEAMKRAGYTSFGPFDWGDDHDSKLIDSLMPEVRIRWVETKHFRIGSALLTYKLPKDSRQRKLLKKDLKELQKILPKVKPKTRKLDPWLRLHLVAFRAERFYQDWLKMLNITQDDLPKAGQEVVRGKYMGRGPHLGMPSKFRILLLNKKGNLTRYSARTGKPQKKPAPYQYYFPEKQVLGFATACELSKGHFFNDHLLHVHLRFNISQLFINGLKFYNHNLPAWIRDGLSNYHIRTVEPKQHAFTGMKDGRADEHRGENWEVKVRKRVKAKFFTAAKTLTRHMDFGQLTFADHMASWSRVDFFISLDKGKKFAQFLDILKGPVPRERGKAPTTEAILKVQDKALKQATGMDWDQFDAAWSRYVLKKYPKK